MDGGSPITNYILEMRVAGESKWNRVNTETVTDLAYTVKRLKEETQYEFRLTAENKAGPGQPSPACTGCYGNYTYIFHIILFIDDMKCNEAIDKHLYFGELKKLIFCIRQILQTEYFTGSKKECIPPQVLYTILGMNFSSFGDIYPKWYLLKWFL